MKFLKRSRARMIIGIMLSIVVILVIAGVAFMNQPSFGRAPRGERLGRVKSPPTIRMESFIICILL